jgi:hypothetical protein
MKRLPSKKNPGHIRFDSESYKILKNANPSKTPPKIWWGEEEI